jgi:hypothetical protein
MSDFLRNLVRRGSGLPPESVPQPPLAVDFPPVVEETESLMEERPAPAFDHAPLHIVSGQTASTPSPVPLARPDTSRVAPQPGVAFPPVSLAGPVAAPDPIAPSPLGGRESSAAAAPSAQRLPDLARSAGLLAGAPGVVPPLAPQSAPASAPTQRESPARLADSGSPSEVALTSSEPGGLVSDREALMQPSQSSTLVWPGETGLAHSRGAVLSPATVREEVGQIVPRPTSAWGADVPLALQPEVEVPAAPEVPRVEVRIGRIEIRATPPPVPAPPASSQRPHGFADYARARRYADRQWY